MTRFTFDRTLVSKTYKNKKLDTIKTNNPTKNGKWNSTENSQKMKRKWLGNIETFNILIPLRNANENYAEISSDSGQMAEMTKDDRWRLGCGERETLLSCWWELILEQRLQKSTCRFLQNQEMDTPQDPAIASLCYNHRTLTILCAHSFMFNVALFIIARKWGQPRHPQLINRG